MATLAYLKVASSGKVFDSEFDLLLDVLELMPVFIEEVNGEYLVANPSMQEENYAEKWNRIEKMEGLKLRQAFYEWHRTAISDLEAVANSSHQGMDMVFASLSSTFGERPVNAARDRIVETISMSRSKGNLGVVLGTGAIAAVTSKAAQSAGTRPTPIAPVKRNNFYGGK